MSDVDLSLIRNIDIPLLLTVSKRLHGLTMSKISIGETRVKSKQIYGIFSDIPLKHSIHYRLMIATLSSKITFKASVYLMKLIELDSFPKNLFFMV